ncbi:thaumatin-like protein [Prosopis cineraria]|uniref:thaumatin-like protein n=1 Tax=Prosopis cineraria TaxID=364024 RepID=UPI00240FF531|nr:thaumatin-like protein [Prosopis cineraria]
MGHSRNSYTIPSPISLTSVFSSGVHPSQPPPPCGFVLWSSVERRLRPKSLFPEKSVTLHNKCSHSVWPGIQPSAGKLLLARGGFKLPPNMSHALKLPPLWSGRFWGRHGCAFKASGRGRCKTGDCGGSLFCNGTGGTPPATFVEFFLGKHHDSYAISLVDGYNLPVSITPYGGSGTCGDVRCVMSDLNLICPAALQVRSHDKRALVACKSACFVAINAMSPVPWGPSSAFMPTADCMMFKMSCPQARFSAYDDPTSMARCTADTNYVITFCPGGGH